MNFVVMVLPILIQHAVGFLSQIGLTANMAPSPIQELRGNGLKVVLMLLAIRRTVLVRDTKPRKNELVMSH